jgi:ABC-type multidrug transport system ATPase subunit
LFDFYELSKGFRQRVCLAQAMIQNPEILIPDEPTSGLDPNQIVEMRKLIRELGHEKTVILSTLILSENFFFRIDLTEGKEYTLSKATRNILRNLEKPVTVIAYFVKDLLPISEIFPGI